MIDGCGRMINRKDVNVNIASPFKIAISVCCTFATCQGRFRMLSMTSSTLSGRYFFFFLTESEIEPIRSKSPESDIQTLETWAAYSFRPHKLYLFKSIRRQITGSLEGRVGEVEAWQRCGSEVHITQRKPLMET